MGEDDVPPEGEEVIPDDPEEMTREQMQVALNRRHAEEMAKAVGWRDMLLELALRQVWALMVLRHREELGEVKRTEVVEVDGGKWSIHCAVQRPRKATAPDIYVNVSPAPDDAVHVAGFYSGVEQAARESAAFSYTPAPEWVAKLLDEDIEQVM
jgi:hypothetical protein